VVGHAILAAILWNRSRSIDLTSKTAITSFYMFIWKVITSSPKSVPDLSPTFLPSLTNSCYVLLYCPSSINWLFTFFSSRILKQSNR
jgi:hypothetical protein